MTEGQILAALEGTTKSRKRANMLTSDIPDAADIRLWRDQLLRFCEELDGDVTVMQIVEALENYS